MLNTVDDYRFVHTLYVENALDAQQVFTRQSQQHFQRGIKASRLHRLVDRETLGANAIVMAIEVMAMIVLMIMVMMMIVTTG